MDGEVIKEGTEVAIEELLGPLNKVERKYAPKQLWIGGDASIFKASTLISVVGSRAASPEGVLRARKLARELVRRGIIVVSGLALGIDTVAHQTAIGRGGRTIAVLATPLECTTPPGARLMTFPPESVESHFPSEITFASLLVYSPRGSSCLMIL